MMIHDTKPANQSVIEETMTVGQLLDEQTTLADQPVIREVLRETTPARELVSQQPMPAHELGFPAAMRHGVAPDVIGVLAVTPNVRVPLRSLGLIAPNGNERDAEDMEERGGAPYVDLGAQVGVMLALEYTAGSRCHRLSNGTFGYARPFRGRAGTGVTRAAGE